MSLEPPPDPLDPTIETVPAGTVLYRVHDPVLPSGVVNDGTVMNPGFGKPTRFAFFGDPPVPALYAADQPEGAVHESILHDAEPGSFIPQAQWQTKVLTAIEVTADLAVAAFRSDGLRRFGLFPADLTDTNPSEYPETVKWPEAVWRDGLHDVAYRCRHYNSSEAVCLFGDRLPTGALRVARTHADTRLFALPEDAEWLASLALAMRVVLRP
ncbi:MAG: RES domain-containing protein [Actinomycetota bacterium]|nr:RES domain-containing protein [Actinomycetota bacterium]